MIVVAYAAVCLLGFALLVRWEERRQTIRTFPPEILVQIRADTSRFQAALAEIGRNASALAIAIGQGEQAIREAAEKDRPERTGRLRASDD